MSEPISEEILSQLRGGSLNQMAQQLGTDTQQTEQAISAALPLLLGALAQNAQQPGGAQALFGAIERDHVPAAGQQAQGLAGGLDLGGLLGSLLGSGTGTGTGSKGAAAAPQFNAEAILGHILGGKQGQAESGLSQATGLNAASVQKLLLMLAPIVMSYLGKQVASGQAQSADQLGSLLGKERQQTAQQGGLAGGLLSAVLDQNGDGKLDMGDLLKLGSGFLNRR
ncbi:DUF937 domain-containing protein [Corticibacter populi]|uniref:DUF937 domain-containing protein n=1 Tax=Corticibacter populi TaxID=1550736 RepID=A0A3M6QTV1_9BURK|nr:DUF937 domain-containing protein [Corticibacter populi]RMX06403.1 DUF937 domain-containing protein [Corticibacter populi]RZS32051.1 uncharacterized protein DUF937 [Corticibacter populi]